MKTFDPFKAIVEAHVLHCKEHEQKYKSLEERMRKLTIRMEKLQEQRTVISRSYLYFIDFIAPKLADELSKHFPEYPNRKVVGPHGLRSSFTIDLFKKTEEEIGWEEYYKSDNLLFITLIPIDISNGVYGYETGETCEKFAPGTLGAINGMNRVTKAVESFDELVEKLKSQIPSNP